MTGGVIHPAFPAIDPGLRYPSWGSMLARDRFSPLPAVPGPSTGYKSKARRTASNVCADYCLSLIHI